MKNIAIIVGALYGGGAERIAGLLSKELSRKYNVYLFLCDTTNKNYEYRGTILNLDINGYNYREYYVAAYKRKYEIDCAISFLEPNNFMNIRTKGKEIVIISERCTQSLFDPPNGNEEYYIRKLYNYADKIISVAYGVKEDLVLNYGIDANNIEVIYNFINKKRILDQSKIELDIELEQFIGTSKLIINVGRLHPQKNQKKLLVQFAKVLNDGYDVKLILVGSGVILEDLQALAKELNISEKVKFITYNHNPFSYYRRADMLAVTSDFEGLPNTILEGFTVGIPIVAVDGFSGPRELLSDLTDYQIPIKKYMLSPRGILVERVHSDTIGETFYLADAIEYLLNNEEFRLEVVNNGRKYIENYSNKIILNKWLDIIEHTEKKNIKQLFNDYGNDFGENYERILIYGAGKVGKKVAAYLITAKYSVGKLCFVVSSKKGIQDKIMNISVYEIGELAAMRNESLVITSVSDKYIIEVNSLLDNLNFPNRLSYKELPINTDYFNIWINGKRHLKEELTNWYTQKTGKELNWDKLVTYNEKIQYMKLFDQIEKKGHLIDKYTSRVFIENTVGKDMLLPILGYYTDAMQINFDELPDKFILECTHGEKWRLIIDKTQEANYAEIRERLNAWLLLDYSYIAGYDMCYQYAHPGIIAKAIEISEVNPILSVVLFNGQAKYLQGQGFMFYESNGLQRNLLNIQFLKDGLYEKMLKTAEIMSIGFKHMIVDFAIYKNNLYVDKIYFNIALNSDGLLNDRSSLELGKYINL